MKKSAMTFLLTFWLVGCGILNPEPVVETANPDEFQTQAAESVTQTIGALQAQSDATFVYQTVLAEITQESNVELVTPTETATATTTPTNTTTPTATSAQFNPLASAVPGISGIDADDVDSLGNPSFKDSFSGSNHWYTYAGDDSRAQVKNGVLEMIMFNPQDSVDWTMSWQTGQHFYAEVTANTQKKCNGEDRYGLLFRAPNTDSGYIYLFSCDGKYRLLAYDGTTSKLVVDWKSSNYIDQGSYQKNVIGVLANGSTIVLYANGHKLRSVTDTSFGNRGRFGLIIGSAESYDFTIEYDNFKLWELN